MAQDLRSWWIDRADVGPVDSVSWESVQGPLSCGR